MTKPSMFMTLTLLSLGLGACSDPPAPSEVRSRITTDLGNVLDQTAAAADGTTARMPGLASFDFLSGALGGGLGSGGESVEPVELVGRVAQRWFRPGRMHQQLVDGDDLDRQAIIDELTTTIFTDANHVGDGIYDVPASLACTSIDYDPNGNEIEALDPECARQWDDVDVRIRVEDDDGTLRFAVQVGANHDEPLSIGLTNTSISVSLDLDAAEAAAEAIAGAFGEQAPNARLSGRVTGTLTVRGAGHIDVDLAIDRALDIAFAEDGVDLDSAGAFRLTSAASHVASVELDGTAGTGELALDVGASSVHIPGDDTLDIVLPGLSAAAVLTPGAPLAITGISLGSRTLTVARNGVQAIAVDLNPDDGRAFDATIEGDGLGNERLTVSPRLDVRFAIDHAALGEDAPVYDITRVQLTGSLISSEELEAVAVDGAFSITTNPASYGFSAATGDCVSTYEEEDLSTGAYYTAWIVDRCL